MNAARLLLVSTILLLLSTFAIADDRKKVVLIAGKKSHGPIGNGIHDYPWSVKLLKVMLDNSNARDRVRVEYHLNGWPADPETLNDADTIMVISDGRDGDKFQEAPHFRSPERAALIERQVKRGCGFMTFHFSTFAPDAQAKQILEWSGGYFDWETDGKRNWYSAIKTMDTGVELSESRHAVLDGVKPFKMREEFYYNIRFKENDTANCKPLLFVKALEGRQPLGNVVAWARQRPGGGRGFGTTCGHFYDNWNNADFRKMVLNAVVWTAGADPPRGGVEAKFYDHDQIATALSSVKGTESATIDDKPIGVLMLAGNDEHKWHNWETTTPAIKALLERDPRIKVDVAIGFEALAKRDLSKYHVLVQNFANWKDPKPPSEAAKKALLDHLSGGGGLIVPHFANGAFHYSLPEAGDSDWPEYRKIVRRVWDHFGKGDEKSGHDAFGEFQVNIVDRPHVITEGLTAFPVTDELYFRQAGKQPIEPLITAKSKVTGREEPLAFPYQYDKARVFQTLLGHSEKTYEAFEVREMMRRAVAWAAHRKPLQLEPYQDANPPAKNEPPKKKTAGPPLIQGRFGQALNPSRQSVMVKGRPDFSDPPLTVECWAKLSDPKSYNILLANHTKASAAHWELFSVAGSGNLTAYLPGYLPDHVRSSQNICDDKWHYLAMVYESTRVRLYIDGKLAGDEKVARKRTDVAAGDFAIGALVAEGLGCGGAIDEVRVSRGVRPIRGSPTEAFKVDDQTIALWRFDQLKENSVPNEVAKHSAARLTSRTPKLNPRIAAPRPAEPNHFGKGSVGFDWTESDSRDGRWQASKIGSFLASIVPVGNQPVRKGLSLRLGEKQAASVCFDTGLLQMRAAWTGDFLQFDAARFGLIASPRIKGKLAFASLQHPGWQAESTRYLGMHRHGQRAVLKYLVNGVEICESPWFESEAGVSAFSREMELSASPQRLIMNVLKTSSSIDLQTVAGADLAVVKLNRQEVLVFAMRTSGKARWSLQDGQLQCVFDASRQSQAGVLWTWRGRTEKLSSFASFVASRPPPKSLAALKQAGPTQWRALTTIGRVGEGEGPYVIDTLTLPFANPYQALFFVSGHDFFTNGDAAICTAHGDVWVVSGINQSLERLEWRRFATGLFQPLGLRIVDDQIYVRGRDQITRLHDHDGDGEADYYENFNNEAVTSPGGHDYVTCLETDREGNFYFAHAKLGVVRVSPDGRELEPIASGLRNPNGLAVGANGVITASPQEGEWTPGSNIVEVRKGGYYGFGGPRTTPDRPLGYDPPLCWIPRRNDNSSGGQVWVESNRWGPLEGQLLHLSFGQCRLLLVLRESLDGQSQGGSISLPYSFESGVMRGRFNNADGQLYVSGMNGWVSNATRDGCFQRLRYTGREVVLPIGVETYANGLALTFASKMDQEAVEEIDNYHVQRWNYLWSRGYGSEEYRASDARRVGRDEAPLVSATLLDDKRTVFLEMEDVQPVMQMSVAYSLRSASGLESRQTYTHTINVRPRKTMAAARLNRRSRPGRLSPEQISQLKPGLAVQYVPAFADSIGDLRILRLAAIRQPVAAPITPFLPPGAFAATFEGFLRVDLPGRYRFSVEGTGHSMLSINESPAVELRADGREAVLLHRGFNRVRLSYRSPLRGDAAMRLMWQAETFHREPVPATAWYHDGSRDEVQSSARLRLGRELLATRNCLRCHQAELGPLGEHTMPELAEEPPHLGAAGSLLEPSWISAWLLEPERFRPHTRMPLLFNEKSTEQQQQARDLAAYLGAGPSNPSAGGGEVDPKQQQALLVAGQRLFEERACIACHRMTAPEADDEWRRMSLHFVNAKFAAGGLKRFLRAPHRHHRTSRMPDFRLSQQEIAALVAYLRSASGGRLADQLAEGKRANGERTEQAGPQDPKPENVKRSDLKRGDPQRGKRLFRELACVNCHRASETDALAKPMVKPLFGTHSASACLHDGPANPQPKAAPRFALAATERRALTEFLAGGSSSLERRSDVEISQRLIKRLRCTACHQRDRHDSDWPVIMIDEGQRGLPPEVPPNLTWSGEKLRADWMQRLFSGAIAEPTRPWLKARMPAFPAHAEFLAHGLAAEHGASLDTPPPSVDVRLARAGARLSGKAGLDCRQCHAVGSEQPTGDRRTKLALGINFAHTRERLRAEHYQRFVLDPPRFDVRTKMPKLSADGKTTAVRELFEGDAKRQFEAIWHFILSAPLVRDKRE